MIFDHLRTGLLGLCVEKRLIRRVVGGELTPWSSEECNIDGIVQFAIAAVVPQLYPWADAVKEIIEKHASTAGSYRTQCD